MSTTTTKTMLPHATAQIVRAVNARGVAACIAEVGLAKGISRRYAAAIVSYHLDAYHAVLEAEDHTRFCR